MKRIIPYILILVILVQLFAPFSVGRNSKNDLIVTNNKAEASDGILVTTNAYKSNNSISGDVRVVWENQGTFTSNSGVIVNLLDSSSKALAQVRVALSKGTANPAIAAEAAADAIEVGTFNFPNLTPSTPYIIQTVASDDVMSWESIAVGGSSAYIGGFTGAAIGSVVPVVGTVVGGAIGAIIGLALSGVGSDSNPTTIGTPIPVTTLAATDQSTNVSAGSGITANEDVILPVCTLMSTDTWGGCLGRAVYWLLFQPSSYIFAATGRLLDISIDYSTKDTSYRSTFVVEGWGIVRDFCNMFFIFVLLYIAFKTILGMSGSKTKEMIVNVVIIGLLINFSLFATQIIIDASNILTRVFYNSQSIAVGPKDANGVIQDQRGSMGEIKISEALVSKINPQKLILEAAKADNIQTRLAVATSTDKTTGKISASTFLLVSLLATIVNVVGLFTFITCALIFISRVIGLWMAMIFAPLAFFSYAVPGLDDMETIGWKKWWPETIKLAFLAPVFIFFLYLIIKFLDSGLGLSVNDDTNGLNFILGIFVPFIFIMILLTKAKDIAKKMSGTIGEQITNGMKAAGAIALGGVAIGGALLGRKVIGQTMARASRGDTNTQRYEAAKRSDALTGTSAAMDKLNVWQKARGIAGSKIGLGKLYGRDKGDYDITTHEAVGVSTGIGGILNRAQKKTQETDFARHTTDEAVEKAGFKGKTINELGAPQQERVKKVFVRDNKSKWAQEEEDKFRRVAGLTDKDALNPTQTAALRQQVTNRAETEFANELAKASKGVNAFTRVVSKVNTGSWDPRDISSMTSDKRASIFTKIPVGLTAAVAMGVRSGIKNVGFSGGGIKVEGNFMKDLGNTISDSLKVMKVNVDLSHVGETKSSGDSHAGGHH